MSKFKSASMVCSSLQCAMRFKHPLWKALRSSGGGVGDKHYYLLYCLCWEWGGGRGAERRREGEGREQEEAALCLTRKHCCCKTWTKSYKSWRALSVAMPAASEAATMRKKSSLSFQISLRRKQLHWEKAPSNCAVVLQTQAEQTWRMRVFCWLFIILLDLVLSTSCLWTQPRSSWFNL